jgi:hypothetical protein
MTQVAKVTNTVAAMQTSSAKGRALMGGTDAMRRAGEVYLPRFPIEQPEDYAARLRMSWLFNGYRKTVRDMTGRVFEKPVEVADGFGRDDILSNVDLQGRDLSTFARDVFEDGLQAGISYIMVDAPPRNGTVTQAQAQAQNLRPYLVHITVDDLLGWKVETINNAPAIVQLRIMETITEPDPKDEFAEIEVQQVRALDRLPQGVQTRLYRKVKTGNAETWQQVDEPTFSGLADITVVPFYANRSGFWTGSPLLDDLADVNIAHWQSQSDQRHILHFARVPILFLAGWEGEDKLAISASAVTTASNPDAKMQWVEHTGAAIGAGRQDLKDLEFQMETFGLQLLVTQGAQSATGEALDARKETTLLAMIADQLQDALEQALIWMGAYGGFDAGNVSVTVNKEYGVSMMTAQELTVMLQAVNTGNMSRETFLKEMVRRGMLASDTDVDAEAERIAAQGPAQGQGGGLGLGGE